ncbi:DUF2768 domain-containing protein [Ureibacillus manganicus]|nr:DUF2768 domain-containing protein [Ureibacillus manganicus]
MQFSPVDLFVLNTARGPLASMHALDVMWVSFYSIGAMLVSVLILSATRKWIKNAFVSFFVKMFAFLLFLVGSFLMVLVVFTWPS